MTSTENAVTASNRVNGEWRDHKAVNSRISASKGRRTAPVHGVYVMDSVQHPTTSESGDNIVQAEGLWSANRIYGTIEWISPGAAAR